MRSTKIVPEDGLEHPGREKMVASAIVLLIITCAVLLGVGIYFTEYSVPSHPYQHPVAWTYRNASIAVGGTVQYRNTIKYINSHPELDVTRPEGFYLEIFTPKSEVAYVEVVYFYFGISHTGSQDFRINYTVYDPAGNLIQIETVSETSSILALDLGDRTILFNLYSIVVVGAEGNYTFRITNVGQYALNATIMLGYGGVSWAKPFFLLGWVVIVLGVADIMYVTALSVHRSRKVS